MPPDPFFAQQLTILFDRDACISSVSVDFVDSQVWLPTDEQLEQWVLAALLHSLTNEQRGKMVEISLNCISADEIRALNVQYRSVDSATNVLSFPVDMPLLPADESPGTPTLLMGDVVVCPHVLEAEATVQNKLLEHHWAHMLIHSVLHLNGYDHEDSIAAEAMESLEIQILSSIGITNPYLAVSAN